MLDNTPAWAEPYEHEGASGWRVRVKVTPKASANKVEPYSSSCEQLRVRVTVAPEDGKANAAVIALLSKHFGCAKSKIVLLSGQTSRIKTFWLPLEAFDPPDESAFGV